LNDEEEGMRVKKLDFYSRDNINLVINPPSDRGCGVYLKLNKYAYLGQGVGLGGSPS
jgi:hypothetical protein